MKQRNTHIDLVGWVVTIAVSALAYMTISYLAIPRIGWSFDFLVTITASLAIGAIVGQFVHSLREQYTYRKRHTTNIPTVVVGTLALVIGLAIIISLVVSTKGFHVNEVKSRLNMTMVSDEEVVEMLPAIDQEGAYSWVDSTSTVKLASRKMGELTDLVNIYTASKTCYTAVENGKLVKYVPLEYAGMLKAMKAESIPGYIKVDPVKQTAEYVESEIHYSPSAFFGHDLMRHARKNYPTEYFGQYTFQVSPEGNPTWVIALERACGSWTVREVYAVALIDAETGACTKYALADAPDWVSCIHGQTAQQIYREAARFVNGWWNPSNLGVTTTTNDWGYVAIDGELYYTTGVTSTVTDGGDESNLGMLLYNAHTNKAYYCEIPGAEEYSAMEEVEGRVQNFGYKAAFPSLTDVNGTMTYVMVLKSDNGVVKQYGMVNYENYTIAATADTLEACRIAYVKAMAETGNSANETLRYQTIIVDSVEYIVQGGETIVYVRDIHGSIYKAAFEEGFLFLETGDSIEVAILDDTSDIVVVTLSKLVSIESVDSKLVSIESVDKSDADE